MSDSYEESFYIVPTYIRKLPGMTLGYMDVYSIIFQFWNKGRECFVKNEVFMERTGFTEKYISNALTYFENLGELKRIMRGKRRYLVKPEKRIEIETEKEQPVDKSPMVELQFRKNETQTASKATRRKGPVSLSLLLNKESLNKELNNHDHAKHFEFEDEIGCDERHMFERLVKLGMHKPLALRTATKYTIATLNNIIEFGSSHGVKNMGAYINTSIQQLEVAKNKRGK